MGVGGTKTNNVDGAGNYLFADIKVKDSLLELTIMFILLHPCGMVKVMT